MKLSKLSVLLLICICMVGCGKTGEEYFNIGITQYNAGKYKESIKSFNKALKLEPENVKARFFLGMSYKNMGDLDNALASIRYAYEISPNDFYIAFALADCCKDQGKFDEAASWARKSLGIKPDFMDAHLLLGICLYRSGKLKEAQDQLEFVAKITEKAKDSVPIYREALATLGALYRDKGDPQASLTVLSQLNSADPNNVNYMYSLATTYLALKDTKKAEEIMNKLEARQSPLAQRIREQLVK